MAKTKNPRTDAVKDIKPKNETIYLDGTDMVMGRLASFIAKQALNGYKVVLFNCERMVLTGNKQQILAYYNDRMTNIKGRHKGPFWPRRPDTIVRRAIKRMLPYKKERGKKAFEEIGVYIGIPKITEGKEPKVFEKAKRPETTRFMYIEELSKKLGSTGWF